MDRKNYDTKILVIFDTIGCYFIDIFYNSLYLKARDMVQMGSAASITDAYRTNVIAYIKGVNVRKDLYMIVVKNLHNYYQKIAGASSAIFSDFEDKILSQFIPYEYYADFTSRHKDSVFHGIIVKTVNDFGTFILKPKIMRLIIDKHMDQSNISLLQDQIVDILIILRETYHSKFVKEITKDKSQVSKAVVEKLKAAFIEEKRARCNAEHDRDKAILMIAELVKKINATHTPVKNNTISSTFSNVIIDKPVKSSQKCRIEQKPQTPLCNLLEWQDHSENTQNTSESLNSNSDSSDSKPLNSDSNITIEDVTDESTLPMFDIDDDPGFG
jgi:hypothetical protein